MRGENAPFLKPWGSVLGWFPPFLPARGNAVIRWGFNPAQIGLIASAYPLGMGLTSMSSFVWIRRASWRSCTVLGLASLGICAVLTIYTTSMIAVLSLMLCAGLGGGVAASPALTALGKGSAGPRNVAIMILLSVLIPSAVLAA